MGDALDTSENIQGSNLKRVHKTDYPGTSQQAISKAIKSTDLRLVEAAAGKGGLSGALEARSDIFRRTAETVYRHFKPKNSYDVYNKPLYSFAPAENYWVPVSVVRKSTAIIKGRLESTDRSKLNAPRSTE